jgi:hypothetical protein
MPRINPRALTIRLAGLLRAGFPQLAAEPPTLS